MKYILKIERHRAWSGIVYCDPNNKRYGDFYTGSKKSKSDYLSVYLQYVHSLYIVCLIDERFRW